MRYKVQSIQTLRILGVLVENDELNQTALVELLGVRHHTVSLVFIGLFSPTLDSVFKYMDAINELAGTQYK